MDIAGMIAIGDGEKCPFCDLIMEDFLIDGKDSFDHLSTEHEKEMLVALFPDSKDLNNYS